MSKTSSKAGYSMKKFLNTYAGRYLIFGLCLFAVVIGVAMVEAHFRIDVAMTDTEITIHSNRYNLRVEYDLIASAELVEMPDRGDAIDGKDETTIKNSWQKELGSLDTLVKLLRFHL